MSDRLENILFKDDWTTQDVEMLRRAMASDPELAALIRVRADVSRQVRARLRDELPDTRLLVLRALSDSGYDAVLSSDERREVEEAAIGFDTALSGDAIRLILNRIQSEADDFEAAWTAAENPAVREPVRLRPDRAPVRNVFPTRPLVRWAYGVAAGLALVVAALVLLRPAASDLDRFIYAAGPGQTHIVSLPDGSTVRLVDGAEMSHLVDPDGFDRQVALEGRAFFDVAESDVQFAVSTTNAVVSVHGTSFGVAASSREAITDVVLVSGSVRFESTGPTRSSVLLEPGQFSRIVGTGVPFEPAPVDLDLALSWADLFIFRETRLDAVVERLSESFDVPITLAPGLGERTVTGTFAREQGLKSILESVAAALDLHVQEVSETGEFRIVD